MRDLRRLPIERLGAVHRAVSSALNVLQQPQSAVTSRPDLAPQMTPPTMADDASRRDTDGRILRFQRLAAVVCFVGTAAAAASLIPNITSPPPNGSQVTFVLSNVRGPEVQVNVNESPSWNVYISSGAEEIRTVLRERGSIHEVCPVELPDRAAPSDPAELCGWRGFTHTTGGGDHLVTFPSVDMIDTDTQSTQVVYTFRARGALTDVREVHPVPDRAQELQGMVVLTWHQKGDELTPPSMRYTSLSDRVEAQARATLLTIALGFLTAAAFQSTPDLIRGRSRTLTHGEVALAAGSAVALSLPFLAAHGILGSWAADSTTVRLVALGAVAVGSGAVRAALSVASERMASSIRRTEFRWTYRPGPRQVARFTAGAGGAMMSMVAATLEIIRFPVSDWFWGFWPVVLFGLGALTLQIGRVWLALNIIRPLHPYLGRLPAVVLVSSCIAIIEHQVLAPIGLIAFGHLELWPPSPLVTALLAGCLAAATYVQVRWNRSSWTIAVWGVSALASVLLITLSTNH